MIKYLKLTFFEGIPQITKLKSSWNKQTVGVAQFISPKSFLMGTIFLLALIANHAWYKTVFYWLHEMAACYYFGADLRN